MPELPDVEGWRRYVAQHAAGRRVLGVRAPSREVLRNTTPQGLGQAVDGRLVGSPRRHGKWLFVPVGEGELLVHFGMTGELTWSEAVQSGRIDRLVLALEGGDLAYRTRRKLGGVWWLPNGADAADVTGALGPDAADLDRSTFRELLADRRGGIKSALMDQELMAGIGNELSDEILWRAGVRPGALVTDISDTRLDAIHEALAQVVHQSMRHWGMPTDDRDWLSSVRSTEDPHCPRCAERLSRSRINGRKSYWCSSCQT